MKGERSTKFAEKVGGGEQEEGKEEEGSRSQDDDCGGRSRVQRSRMKRKNLDGRNERRRRMEDVSRIC